MTPYLSEKQIVSGTLAYAMSVGKATVSTPYWYAEEMLAEERGILVDFKDSKGLAQSVNALLDDEGMRNAMRKKAYTYSRKAVWSQVAVDYMAVFNEVKVERTNMARLVFETKTLEQDKASLPDIKLDHLLLLTDETGIAQHATFSIPDYNHGYCIDDNARALIMSVMAGGLMQEDPHFIRLQKKYLAFIKHALIKRTVVSEILWHTTETGSRRKVQKTVRAAPFGRLGYALRCPRKRDAPL